MKKGFKKQYLNGLGVALSAFATLLTIAQSGARASEGVSTHKLADSEKNARIGTHLKEGAYLDPAYTGLVHPRVTDGAADAGPVASVLSEDIFESESPILSLLRANATPGQSSAALPAHSDVEQVISFQTPVRAQESRGTCSFFSTTAVLEAELIRAKKASADLRLSEQWLAYVVGRENKDDGSHSNPNFNLLAYYGTVEQSLMPYEGEVWESASQSELSRSRCGSVPPSVLRGCLISHYDPRLLTQTDETLKASNPAFFAIRDRAREFRARYLASSLDWHQTHFEVRTTSEIKSLLAQGVPLTMDIAFYFGAWNHELADNYDIGRDPNAWDKGVIGYPAKGSVDRAVSPKHRSAHSVVIVGYDDDAEVHTRVLMSNGQWQAFTYRGVYYFKNSWGTDSFGAHFEVNGVAHPGYGMITQAYAHEMGAFYHLPIQ